MRRQTVTHARFVGAGACAKSHVWRGLNGLRPNGGVKGPPHDCVTITGSKMEKGGDTGSTAMESAVMGGAICRFGTYTDYMANDQLTKITWNLISSRFFTLFRHKCGHGRY